MSFLIIMIMSDHAYRNLTMPIKKHSIGFSLSMKQVYMQQLKMIQPL